MPLIDPTAGVPDDELRLRYRFCRQSLFNLLDILQLRDNGKRHHELDPMVDLDQRMICQDFFSRITDQDQKRGSHKIQITGQRSVSKFTVRDQESRIRIKDHGSRSRIMDLAQAFRITIDLAQTRRSLGDLGHRLDPWIRIRIPAQLGYARPTSMDDLPKTEEGSGRNVALFRAQDCKDRKKVILPGKTSPRNSTRIILQSVTSILCILLLAADFKLQTLSERSNIRQLSKSNGIGSSRARIA
ncbi:hypothetical protein FOL47_007941 [Perkinsus chesapeaki]|uniref:Uncharacterized protein n=1 Tax=Perkinsus chesapeaki TaxID=330153 RepID=A0A7J6MUU8_PERCH|nr:hypothetical protein FOL47_007941 [Perkinsus chesapeaki]